MLLYFASPVGLDLEQLMCVYRESLDRGELFSSLQDFYTYWLQDFFSVEGTACAVWEEEAEYVSVLRLEPYRDGFLVTGLETRPERRQQGMADKLISAVLQRLKVDGHWKLYSHVHRNNLPSLRLHKTHGFFLYSDHAVFLDGSISRNYDTYMLKI